MLKTFFLTCRCDYWIGYSIPLFTYSSQRAALTDVSLETDFCKIPKINIRAQLFKNLDNAILWTNLYPVDSVNGFPNTYLLENDLSGGQRYPMFEQLWPSPISFRGLV